MGQYYTPLIKRDGEYTAYDTGVGYKLTEQSWIGSVPDKIATLLYKNPAEFAWVGDYGNETEWEKSFHRHAFGNDIIEHSMDSISLLDITDKYIINHTKHEYIDMKEYMEKTVDDEWGQMHPLSLMTAIGNGRGGGDYSSPVNIDKIGSWAGDVISIEDEAPKGFKSLDVWFSEDTHLIKKWEKDNKSISFYIKDYLLDNGIGYKSEVDSDRELFNNVDITSVETIMPSVKRVELEINSDVVEIIENAGIKPDWAADWINFYVNCDCTGNDFQVEAVLICENKDTGNTNEIPIPLSAKQISDLEEAIKHQLWTDRIDVVNEIFEIKGVFEAAKEIDDVGSDSLVVTEFGDLNVTIKISKNIDEGFDPDYDIEVYAPQSKEKLLSENKRYLGSEYNIEESSLLTTLKNIENGSFVITTNAVRNQTATIADAVKNFKFAHKTQKER